MASLARLTECAIEAGGQIKFIPMKDGKLGLNVDAA
jgi:hypothetical protein